MSGYGLSLIYILKEQVPPYSRVSDARGIFVQVFVSILWAKPCMAYVSHASEPYALLPATMLSL
ncbi:MAG: hypothetical protein ACJA2B_000044 [Candidatus Endobugula sp.]|jgi:hypothetical protein